jgi:putative transposase
MGRRKWTAEQKFGIVLQGIKGETTITQLCSDHGISQVQYYKWRDQFFSGAKQNLNSKRAQNGTSERMKIKELERIIGKQTVTIEILKKIQGMENE